MLGWPRSIYLQCLIECPYIVRNGRGLVLSRAGRLGGRSWPGNHAGILPTGSLSGQHAGPMKPGQTVATNQFRADDYMAWYHSHVLGC